MNRNRLTVHVAGATAVTGVWETGVALAPGAAPVSLFLVGVIGPAAVATLSLLLQAAARDTRPPVVAVDEARPAAARPGVGVTR